MNNVIITLLQIQRMQEKCEEFATRVVKIVPQDDHR